ncbi:hypothetical protein R1sor_016112 [Riccia sorocarpa]|uniref:Uncharacterized protein n=1 Tax=Riccia sorocarpa TaxID=122646 RepID=A0ABD3HEG3_9MARC
MAAIPAKAVHALVQQLDLAAVENNKELGGDDQMEQEHHAVLLLESLGIHHWLSIQHTFSSKGEEATLTLIRQLHEELPNLLEADSIEDGRADKLAGIIARVLSWTDLNKNSQTQDGADGVNGSCADISSQVKANPLINFSIFSEEEKMNFTEGLDNLNANAAEEKASVNDGGDPYIPIDTPRTIEYRVSGKNGMMWKCANMNNLAPFTLDMWAKLENMWEGEINLCKSNAIQGVIPAKARYMAFLMFLGGEARSAILAQYAFMHTRQMMIQTAMEVFADPTNRTLPEHGDANGVRTIERLIKPACFSDSIISSQIQGGGRRRTRHSNHINLNSAPTRMVPMGRGQRMRGGRQFHGNRPFHHTPGSSSSSSRSFSSSASGFSGSRPDFRSSPLGRRNMSNEFDN